MSDDPTRVKAPEMRIDLLLSDKSKCELYVLFRELGNEFAMGMREVEEEHKRRQK